MKKKASLILATFFAFLVLAACSSSAAQATTSINQSSNTSSPGNTSGSASLENRLAPGILKLEGTNLAVTAQQATQLLPLWQQVQTLDTSGTAQTSDYTTVYQQIESTLTSDQVNAIQAMSLTQSDMQTLMTSLGIQVTPGAFGGGSGSRPTQSPDQLATRTAQRTLTPGAPGGGGFVRGTGTPPAGGQFGSRGMNTMFVAPLIQLLQQRAGS